MKAKFLKRSESEKSDKVKVIFEVDSADIANQLEKGQSYEIELYEAKLPNMTQSANEMLKVAQGLISQAIAGIPEERESVLPLSCDKKDKKDEKCGNCATWTRAEGLPNGFEVPQGECKSMDAFMGTTPIYHWCSYWRSNAEKDKTQNKDTKEGDVCDSVAREESHNKSAVKCGSPEEGIDRPE